MALDFRVATIKFDATRGITQHEPGTATFSTPVKKANIALRSYYIGYTDADHHLWKMEIKLSPKLDIIGPTVNFDVDFLLRDSSGNIDDRYNGWVEVLVMADVA